MSHNTQSIRPLSPTSLIPQHQTSNHSDNVAPPGGILTSTSVPTCTPGYFPPRTSAFFSHATDRSKTVPYGAYP